MRFNGKRLTPAAYAKEKECLFALFSLSLSLNIEYQIYNRVQDPNH